MRVMGGLVAARKAAPSNSTPLTPLSTSTPDAGILQHQPQVAHDDTHESSRTC